MAIQKRTLAWLVLGLWMVSGAALAERRARLVGKLVDPDGNAIQGVAVTVTSPQIPGYRDTETTDKKGVFTVDFRQVDVTYHYRFDKVGYQTMEVEQKWSLEGTQMSQWTMHPGQTALPSASGPAASTSQEAIEAYNAGVAASKAKDYATAATKFNEAVQHDPKLRQAWESLAVVQLPLGHNQECVDAAEKALALGSTDQAVLESRWQAYRNLKDDAKADAALKDLERIGRKAEEAKKVHNEAVALMKAKDYAGAFAKFQEALAIDPNQLPSLFGLAESGLKIGKNAEAATAAETVLKSDPKNDQAIRIQYNACLALGDKERLVSALMTLAAVEPVKARDGLLRLAFDAYDANDMPTAKARFGKALQLDPNYPQAYYFLGLIAVGENKSAEARSNFERFLQLAPNDPEAPSAREALKYLKP